MKKKLFCSLRLVFSVLAKSAQSAHSLTAPVTHTSLPGYKQAAEGTAATGEEETTGGEAPSQSPGEQEQSQGR